MDVNGLLHAPAILSSGNNFWYPLNRRPGEAQSTFGHLGEEKIFLQLLGIEPRFLGRSRVLQ